MSPSPTIGEKEIIYAKHDKNLSTYRLNVLKIDKTLTLSRICKFAYSSLTNSTLSQKERVKYGFTLAEVFSPCRKVKLNFGFTLAEVLITLGIIGVVAAVIIPSLIQKYQEQETVTRLKNVYSTVSNAYIRILEEDGDPTNWGMNKDNFATITTEKFSKYIKNVKICDSSKQNSRCFVQKRLDLLGNNMPVISGIPSLIMPNGAVIGFSTQDWSQIETCEILNFCFCILVDVNGNREPNQWGHDTFTFHANRNKILARGAQNTHGSNLCDPVNAIGWAGWPNGTACSAYVLQEGNMDYLKCIRGNTSYCSKKYYFANY